MQLDSEQSFAEISTGGLKHSKQTEEKTQFERPWDIPTYPVAGRTEECAGTVSASGARYKVKG